MFIQLVFDSRDFLRPLLELSFYISNKSFTLFIIYSLHEMIRGKKDYISLLSEYFYFIEKKKTLENNHMTAFCLDNILQTGDKRITRCTQLILWYAVLRASKFSCFLQQTFAFKIPQSSDRENNRVCIRRICHPLFPWNDDCIVVFLPFLVDARFVRLCWAWNIQGFLPKRLFSHDFNAPSRIWSR